ncbi:MAG: P-loop NTPase fold protein [Candidatus Marinimicrobia bacterium]|nr:P-loop NTPase fold protein [Candidatus Neomarinimicrobiota bacterium]
METKENHNKHISTYLDWYLELDNPKFAVMIKGKWGSGKTYFIQKYQEEKTEEEFINISLNGITTIKEIDQQLFCQIYPLMNNRLIGPLINLGVKFLPRNSELPNH